MARNDDTSSPHPAQPISPEAILRVITGKATPEEAQSLRELAARDPAVAHSVAVLRDVRGAIESLLAEAADPPPASLLERAAALAAQLPRPPSWFDRVRATALVRIDGLAADLAGGPALAPALRGGSVSSMCSFADETARIDVSAMRSADGSFTLRIQFDTHAEGSLAGDFAVLDSESGEVLAAGVTSDDGAASVGIGGGAPRPTLVDVAVRLNDQTVVAGRIPLE